MSLQSGLFYSRKGFATDEEELESDEYDKYFFSYLEAPLHLIYHKDKFQAFAGPYFSYGLSGVNKWKYSGDTESEQIKPSVKKVNADDDDFYFNAIDYGLDFGVGYQVGPILLNVGYSFGLGNIQPKYEDVDLDFDIKMSYRAFSLSGTYFFGSE